MLFYGQAMFEAYCKLVEGDKHMVDFDQNWDQWNDADMADQKALDTGVRYIGYVQQVDQDVAKAREGETFADGRTTVPQIVLTFVAVGKLGKGKFGNDDNYYPTATKKFWTGQADTKSRNWLRRLVMDGSGKSKEEIAGLSLTESAKLLAKTYFTYEVTNKEGSQGGVFSTAVKIKAATLAEIAQVS